MSSTSTKTQRKTISPSRVIALVAASWLFAGCGGGAPVVRDELQADTLPADPLAVPAERVQGSGAADVAHTAFAMALFDADPAVRMDAASELGVADVNLDRHVVSDLLATAAADSNKHVRASAVEAAIELARGGHEKGEHDKAAHELLAYALLDSQPGVREVAIDGLLEIGGDESVRILGTALTDVDVSVREEVVYALGAIGSPVSVSLLRQAAADPDPDVRQTAAEQLARLGPFTD